MKKKSSYSFSPVVATIKTLKGLGWAVAVIMLCTVAFNALAAEPPRHVNYREMQHMISVMGLEIRDSQDRKLGKIADLAIDLENGDLVEVIVASGGFLGLGRRTVAVPPGALVFDPEGGVLRLNVGEDKFKAAPDFVMSKRAEQFQSRSVAEVYRYYGQEPYFAADGQDSKSGNTATEPLGYVQLTRNLILLPVKNLQNEPIGTVDTFLFDLFSSRGGLTHVIVLNSGFLQTKSVIPATLLRFNDAHNALYLDVSRKALKIEPRFNWAYGGNDGYGGDGYFQQETYTNKKVETSKGVNTRQNFREGTTNTYTPLAQGASFEDVYLTYRIYKSMNENATLSQNAQNVEVGTVDGRVTLRGHVNTEEAKRIIGEIAAMHDSPENVSNLLEVRPVPATDRQAK